MYLPMLDAEGDLANVVAAMTLTVRTAVEPLSLVERDPQRDRGAGPRSADGGRPTMQRVLGDSMSSHELHGVACS